MAWLNKKCVDVNICAYEQYRIEGSAVELSLIPLGLITSKENYRQCCKKGEALDQEGNCVKYQVCAIKQREFRNLDTIDQSMSSNIILSENPADCCDSGIFGLQESGESRLCYIKCDIKQNEIERGIIRPSKHDFHLTCCQENEAISENMTCKELLSCKSDQRLRNLQNNEEYIGKLLIKDLYKECCEGYFKQNDKGDFKIQFLNNN